MRSNNSHIINTHLNLEANGNKIKNVTTHYKLSIATSLAAYKSMVDTKTLLLFPPHDVEHLWLIAFMFQSLIPKQELEQNLGYHFIMWEQKPLCL